MKTRKVKASDIKAARQAFVVAEDALRWLCERAREQEEAGFGSDNWTPRIADASRKVESSRSHLQSVSASGARLIVR